MKVRENDATPKGMRPPRPAVLLAPGAPAYARVARAPAAQETLPPVDERLVVPETRFEIVRGRVMETMACDEPHGTANGQLAYVLGGVVRAEFTYAIDMLLRTDRFSDFAPDASVFPKARDGKTGGRQLEHMVFEVKDSQRLSKLKEKASLMSERGVRRIFCLDVPGQRVLEWAHSKQRWDELPKDGTIEDRTCWVRPVPVQALLNAAAADATVALALLAKKEPNLQKALAEQKAVGHQAGMQEGLRRTVAELCEVFAIPLTPRRRAELKRLDDAGLEALCLQLKTTRQWPLFGNGCSPVSASQKVTPSA